MEIEVRNGENLHDSPEAQDVVIERTVGARTENPPATSSPRPTSAEDQHVDSEILETFQREQKP